jgi:hypothetical protein
MEVSMSGLTPEDEALLERARMGGGEASPDDQARVKRRLFAQLGLAVGTSAVAASGGASAGVGATGATTSAWLGSAGKIVVAFAIGAGAGTGVVVSYHARAPQTASVSPLATPDPASPRVAASAEPARASENAAAEVGTEDIAPAVPSTFPHRERPARLRAVDVPISPGAPQPLPPPRPPKPRLDPSGPATVAAEADLLRQADAAVKAGDAARALALLGEHATKFPSGMLVEERESERVVVLCALGRTGEARAAAAQFLRLRPRSPLSQRVRESCGGS